MSAAWHHLFEDVDCAERMAEARRELEVSQQALLADLLEVLDSLDRLGNIPGAVEPDSVRLVREQLWDVLERHGVRSIQATGGPFNPFRHQAAGSRPAAGFNGGQVVEEVLSGFESPFGILRPARVIVSKDLAMDDVGENGQ